MEQIYILEDSQQSKSGGGQQVSAKLIRYLVENHDVSLTLFDTTTLRDSFLRNCDNVKYRSYWRPRFCPPGAGPSFTYSLIQCVFVGIAAMAESLRLFLSIPSNNPENKITFYCPTKFGYIVAILPGLVLRHRIIFHLHNVAEDNFSFRFFQLMLRYTADEIICVSRTVYESIQHPSKKLIRNPGPAIPPIRRVMTPSCRRIGVVASFFPYKGHLFFLTAVRHLMESFPEINIYLYGDGQELEPLAKEFASDRIHFMGRVNNIDDIYVNLDVVVIPSLKSEAFSLVIPEAWSRGCLVLASNLSAHFELINDGANGYVFETGDESELIRKVRNIITNWPAQELLIDEGYKSLTRLNSLDFFSNFSKLLLSQK